MTVTITVDNLHQYLRLSTPADWESLQITAQGVLVSLKSKADLTPEQLQEVVDLAVELRESAGET